MDIDTFATTRRGFLKLGAGTVLAGSAVSLLQACGSPAANTAKGSVSFLAGDPTAVWGTFIKYFEKQSGTHVDFQYVPFATLDTTLTQRLQTHDASLDAFYVDPPTIPSMVKGGYLEDLTPTFGSQVRSQCVTAAADAAFSHGKLWTMPVWTSTCIVFYNKELLQKAGVDAPSADPSSPITWEQLAADAAKVKAAGADWGIVFGQPTSYYELQPLPMSLGGGSGVSGACGLKVDVTNEAWVKAMTWYQSLYVQGLSPKGSTTAAQTFAAGQAGYYIDVDSVYGTLLKSPNLQWGVAAFPYFRGGHVATPTDSWHLGISKFTNSAATAHDLLKYAGLDPKGNLTTGGPLPTNKVAFQEYLDGLDKTSPNLAGAKAIIGYQLAHNAVHRPGSLGYNTLQQVMATTFTNIVDGADPKAQLQTAQSQMDQQFSQLSC